MSPVLGCASGRARFYAQALCLVLSGLGLIDVRIGWRDGEAALVDVAPGSAREKTQMDTGLERGRKCRYAISDSRSESPVCFLIHQCHHHHLVLSHAAPPHVAVLAPVYPPGVFQNPVRRIVVTITNNSHSVVEFGSAAAVENSIFIKLKSLRKPLP